MKIFIRYGELVLKLGNRNAFERRLEKNILSVFKGNKVNSVRRYGHLMLEIDGLSEDEIASKLKRVFGISNFSFVKDVEQDLKEISKVMISEIKKRIKRYIENGPKTFCVRVHRVQRDFPMNSGGIEREIGGMILDKLPNLKVKLELPDITCHADFADKKAYVYFDKVKGLDGLPVEDSNKVVSMISSGIDSPVAAFKIMSRGVKAVFVHFHSYPHTNSASQENVKEIVKILAKYQGESKVYFIPFVDIQKKIMMLVKPEIRVILYRWFMIKIAQKIARNEGAKALVTGESLGQVASQTLDNIFVTNAASEISIFRPLIAYCKQDIVDEARQIDTFEISIKPYADCCTLFVPKHPSVSANLKEIQKINDNKDFEKMIDLAIKKSEILNIK